MRLALSQRPPRRGRAAWAGLLALAVLALAAPPSAPASDYYVSPTGTAFGTGAKASPLSFICAWTNTCSTVTLTAGDVVWGLDGIYNLALSSTIRNTLAGTALDPIIFRCYPGAVCSLDVNQQPGTKQTLIELSSSAQHVWFWGWRLYNSYPKRMLAESGSSPAEERGGTLFVYAPDSRVIDLYAHDGQNGLGSWRQAQRSWIDTVFTMHAGWSSGDRGHGHCYYIQNEVPTKIIYNAIGIRCLGNGFNIFGTNAPVDYMLFRHIASTQQGLLGSDLSALASQTPNMVHRTGLGPVKDVEFDGAFFYWDPQVRSGGIDSGDATIDGARRLTVRNAVIAGSIRALNVAGYTEATIVDSTFITRDFVGEADVAISLDPSSAATPANFLVDRNVYYSNSNAESCAPTNQCNWRYDNGVRLSFAQWKALGFDATSVEYLSTLPSEPIIQVSPSAHDRGVGYVKVLNYSPSDDVLVDLSPILRVGDAYAVYDAQYVYVSPTSNVKAPPLAAGTWDGAPITLPTNLTQVMAPIGEILRVDRTPQGTISCTGTSCTGSGTAFLTSVAVNDRLFISPREARVASVASNTQLTLVSPFTSNPSGAAYDIVKSAIPAVAEHTSREFNVYRVERLPESGARIEVGDDEVLATVPCVTGLAKSKGTLRLFFDPLRQEMAGSALNLPGIERQRTVAAGSLTPATTYYYWADCGIQSIGSFTTREAQSGAKDVKFELSGGPANADDVIVDWGYGSISENSIQADCDSGCTIVLPDVDLARVYRYRITRRDAADNVLTVSREFSSIQ